MMRSSGAVWRRTTGREIKHTGDGIMAVFADIPSALRAAGDIQWHFWLYNLNVA